MTAPTKRAKRPNGEGTEPRIKDGKWFSRVMVDGKAKDVWGESAADVTRKKRELFRRSENNEPLTQSKVRVAQWVDEWKVSGLNGGKRPLAQGTKDKYRDAARIYVVPVIGHMPIKDVTPFDCTAVLDAMEAAGKSGSYRKLVWATMSRIFKAAKAKKLIPVSPMLEVECPSPDDHEATWLTREQAADLVAALADTRGTRTSSVWLDVVQVCLLTGLRRGEVLGLRWEDIDDEVIGLAVQTVRTSKGLGQADLKTRGSKRDIDVVAPLEAVFRRRKKAQMADRLKCGTAWTETGLVFTTGVGTVIEPNNFNRAFRAAVRRAGLPTTGEHKVTPHTLRHSAATMLLEMGVSMKEVQKIMGHGRLATTMDIYAHVSPERRAAAMTKLGEALGWGT